MGVEIGAPQPSSAGLAFELLLGVAAPPQSSPASTEIGASMAYDIFDDISFGVFFVRVLGPDQSIYALVLAGENDFLVPESLLGVPDLYAAIFATNGKLECRKDTRVAAVAVSREGDGANGRGRVRHEARTVDVHGVRRLRRED